MESKDKEWRAFGGPGLLSYRDPLSSVMGDAGTAALLPKLGLGGALADSGNSSSSSSSGMMPGSATAAAGTAAHSLRFTATTGTNTSPQLAAILGGGPLSASTSTSSSASSVTSGAGAGPGLLSSASKPFVPRQQQLQQQQHQQHPRVSPALTGSSVGSGSLEAAPSFMLPPLQQRQHSQSSMQQPQPQQQGGEDDTAALCLQMASSCLFQDHQPAAAAVAAGGGGGKAAGGEDEDEDDVVGLAMEAALDRAYLLLDEEDDAVDDAVDDLLMDDASLFFSGAGGSFGSGSGSGLGSGHGGGSGTLSLGAEPYGDVGAPAAAGGGFMGGFYGDNGGGYGEAYGGGGGGGGGYSGPPMPGGYGRQGSHPGYGGGYHPHHHHHHHHGGGGGFGGHGGGGQQMYLRDAAVSVLLEYFPQCSPRALLVALRRCEFDIEAAARCVEAALRPSVPPCRYFLAGFCARSDCQYSHDVAQMPCTYWLMGGCRDPKEGPTPEDEELHEGSCCFLHDFPPMPAPPTPPLSALTAAAAMGLMALPPAAAPPAASPTISPDDEEQFPALTLSKPSSSSSTTATSTSSSSKPAGAPTAAPSNTSSTNSSSTSTGQPQQPPAKSFLQVALSTDKVKKPTATSAGGGASATAAGAAGGAGSSGAGAGAGLSASVGAGGVRTVGLKDLVSRQKLANVWVMGGEEVRRQYQKAREEASRAAQARNRCFMRATEAFQRGDKAAAAALGEQGRNMNALMRAQHRQAALAIFATRNPSDARIYKEGIVDLHGLHVQEALEMLEELLPDVFRVSGAREVLVITGTGRHSGAVSKHQSRLFPELDKYLLEIAGAMARKQSRGTNGAVSVEAAAAALYSHVADPAGHKGGFRIKVNRRLMEYWGAEL